MSDPLPLRLVVAVGCAACARARVLAAEVRRLRPGHPVEVVELADGGRLPDGVVGTPTWLLGNGVVSLGNPEIDRLLATLDAGGPQR